jgi:hypothetical protein
MMNEGDEVKREFTDSFFDWYQVTFSNSLEPEELIAEALRYFDLSSAEPAKPRVKQYYRGVNLVRGSHTIFHVCWGGCNEGIHLLSTGSVAHEVEIWLRGKWQGGYIVSRADVRIDTVSEGAFEYLYGLCKGVSDVLDIKRKQLGDWDVEGSPSGRTYYVGSKSSVVQVRLYEKGKESGGDKNWVRLEIQVRPAKRIGKEKASAYEPEQFWKCSAWSSLLYATVFNHSDKVKPETLGTVWSLSDQERALRALVSQYGNTLEKLADDLPYGWDSIGRYLFELRCMSYVDDEHSKSFILPRAGFGENPFKEVLRKVVSSK